MKVLIVDVDSLRPDHLGCYGYDRDTSPTIDSVAADGVRFDQCFVSDSPCLPSRTALATGRHGAKTGVVTHFGDGQWYDQPGEGHDPDVDRQLAFQHLAQNGVRTASVSSFTQRHMAYHFSAGFQDAIQPTAETGLLAVEDGGDVTNAALDWLDVHAGRDDWLLHVNYWDVHHPYQGIEEYVDEVRASGDPSPWPDEDALDDLQDVVGPRTANFWPNPSEYEQEWYEEKYAEWPIPEQFETRSDVEHVLTGYDAAIRKVDAEVRRILDALEAAGVRDETAVIVTGDHGEAFGEHGVFVDHAFPDPACQQVPLIVSWPDVTGAGNSVDEKIYQFDLVASVCDLLGVDVPDAWDAQSFRPALEGGEFEGRETLVCGHGIYTFGRAVYRDDWMYARLFHPGVFSYPGMFNDSEDLPRRGLELLHDLEADPHMTENLVDDRPEVATELRAELDRWMAETTGEQWPSTRPVESVGEDPLAAMAPEGPFLYVDPDEFLDFARHLDHWDDAAVRRIEETLDAYPRAE